MKLPFTSKSDVSNLFKDLDKNNINYVVADWTNRDKEILDVLNIYGRSGVPLYVFWKPGMDKSIVLPAILTESLVLDTIRD